MKTTLIAEDSSSQLNQQLFSDEAIINSVVSDLGDLPALVNLLNGQLHAITEETERSAYVIMERLQGMDGVINELVSTVTTSLQDTGGTNEPDEKCAGSKVDLVASLTDCNNRLMERDKEMLAFLNNSNSTLSSMFMDVLSNIQFQDVTRQQIEQVQNALARLDTHVVQMVEMMRSRDFSNAASIKEHIDQIYEGYVMEKQRDIHASTIDGDVQTGGDSANPQKIELF